MDDPATFVITAYLSIAAVLALGIASDVPPAKRIEWLAWFGIVVFWPAFIAWALVSGRKRP